MPLLRPCSTPRTLVYAILERKRLALEAIKQLGNFLSLSRWGEKGLQYKNMPNPSHIPKTFLTRNVPKLKSDQCVVIVMYNLKRLNENLVLYKMCGVHLSVFQFPPILIHFHTSFFSAQPFLFSFSKVPSTQNLHQ